MKHLQDILEILGILVQIWNLARDIRLLILDRKAGRIIRMSVFLFIVGLLFLLGGVVSWLSSWGVSTLAQSVMHQIYAAEITGNAILLFGFGFLLIGVSRIIDQSDNAKQSPPPSNTRESNTFDNARPNATHKQPQSISHRKNNDAENLHKEDAAEDLFWAASRGHLNITNSLINKGADVNVRSSVGDWCPLHWAAEKGHIDVANALIEAGADVNAKTSAGKTPLHLAAQEDKADMATALINAGADLRIRSNDHKTPLQIAKINGNTKTAELLQNAATAAKM